MANTSSQKAVTDIDGKKQQVVKVVVLIVLRYKHQCGHYKVHRSSEKFNTVTNCRLYSNGLAYILYVICIQNNQKNERFKNKYLS